VNAFRYFGGYPEEILYDNMKQVVIKRLMKQEEIDTICLYLSMPFLRLYSPRSILRPFLTGEQVHRTIII
jgi:transposase